MLTKTDLENMQEELIESLLHKEEKKSSISGRKKSKFSEDNNPIEVCIRLNRGGGSLKRRKENERNLLSHTPKLEEIAEDSEEEDPLLNSIIKEVFITGLSKKCYLRNLSPSSDKILFGIRPIRTEGDFCDRFLDENETLLFLGHRFITEEGEVGISIIDSIQIIQETEKKDYEAECELNIVPNPNPSNLSFTKLIAEIPSIRENTKKNLDQWKGYLKWRRQITNKQIHGAKYFNFKYNEENNTLTFALIFESKEVFEKEKRYLKRDACIFNNLISLDFWKFNYDRELTHVRNCKKSFGDDTNSLGLLQGFSNEAELTGIAEENPLIIHEHPNSKEMDTEIVNTSSEGFSIGDLQDQFKNAFIIYATYKLPDELLQEAEDEEEAGEEASNEKANNKEIEKYLSAIPKNGFIALSAAGDFALIRRFELAIKDLEEGNCYSQTLINWLFDVKQAALPVKDAAEITEWANPKIAQNENQRLAVEKALNAEELFLLQGPPGTGKTTVIAEIIYQFARKGLRVLVSSQSNDAVDNALDRLSNTPFIRAIRLGGRGGKKKKKNDEEQECKYIEKEALKYYYQSLSKSISSTFLDVWNNVDVNIDKCNKDLRDFSVLQKDSDDLGIQLAELQSTFDTENTKYSQIREELKKIESANSDKENLRRKLVAFKDFIDNGKPYDLLPEDFSSILQKELSGVRGLAEKNGITIPENFILAHSLVTTDLKKLSENLKNAGGSNNVDSEFENLSAQIDLVRKQLSEAAEDGNDALSKSKKKELDDLKLKRDKLSKSGGIELSSEVRKAFAAELQDKCKSDKAAVRSLLEELCKKWENAISSSLTKIQQLIQSNTSEEMKALVESKNSLEGKIKVLNQELDDKQKQRKAKSSQIRELCSRYELSEDTSNIDLSNAIKSRLKELKAEQKKSNLLHTSFGDTMKKFCQKLDDVNTYQYDNEYFLESYINSCNVVGISCTNNMKNLSDKGFDNFDVVIIDEVSKATPPELLIPLMKAGKVILVGDHRQLPPMFEEHEKSYKEMIDDLSEEEEDLREVLNEENFKKYKNMVTASLFKAYFEQADAKIKHSLLTQYRMHSDIMNVINRFYDGRLQNGNSPEVEKKEKAHNLLIDGIDGSSFIQPKNHVYWLDSSALPGGTRIYETFRQNSTSACNILEKHLIIELLKKIATEYKKQGLGKKDAVSVGVISFYQRQVNEIRAEVKKLRNSKEYKDAFEAIDIDVNTVDRFQGKEKNIIITSLVRNNKQGNASKHVVTYERINVAFSRAQNLLFIVGAEHTYKRLEITIPKMDSEGELTLPVYANIIDDLKRHGCFADSKKLISPEVEKNIIKEYNETR